MKILEVRDGFIKLETRATITTGTFIEAKEEDRSFVAQIVRTVPTGEYSILVAKILFVYDGIFNSYNGELPKGDLTIALFPFDEVNKIFETPTSINFILDYQSKNTIKIDKNIFNKKFLASLDNVENIKNLVSVFQDEFSKQGKHILIDTLGVVNDEKKCVAGVDFKLPLNTAALAFLYEECLNDATADSKSMIKEIFQDLSEYSKTVPFLPFSTLKTIIDDMVEKQHVFKLLVLKNKLSKFDKLGYFAADKSEVEQLEDILCSRNLTIDLSKLDQAFQNRYLEAIYLAFEKIEEKPQVTLLASNNLTKKSLKTVLTSNHSATALIVNSRFKYLKDIKPMFNNFLIEPNFANNETFKSLSTTLSAMPKTACLFVGKGTNNIQLVSEINYRELVDNEVVVETEVAVEEYDLGIEPVEKDEQTLAIEKKSDDLIEKISEEVEVANENVIENLFAEEDDEENVSDNEQAVAIVEDFVEDIDEDELMYKEDEVQFATQVHPEINLDEDDDDFDDEDTVTSMETVVESVEKNEDMSNSEDIVEEGITSLDDEITEINDDVVEVEMPADIVAIDEDASLDSENVIEEYIEPVQLEDNSEIIESEVLEETPIVEEENTTEEFVTLELDDADVEEEFEEIVELNEADLENADDLIMIDVEDDVVQEIDEETEKEIVEDVDKVFTTIREDSISDSDLDFIDELNGENSLEQNIEEYSSEGSLEELPADYSDNLEEATDFIEPLQEFTSQEDELSSGDILETRSASTPTVPVYDADIPQEDIVMSDPLEQGDSVVHAKYGNGVVEKMINYGTKTLYSINFENVGRRLLDPSITEIKKA